MMPSYLLHSQPSGSHLFPLEKMEGEIKEGRGEDREESRGEQRKRRPSMLSFHQGSSVQAVITKNYLMGDL